MHDMRNRRLFGRLAKDALKGKSCADLMDFASHSVASGGAAMALTASQQPAAIPA